MTQKQQNNTKAIVALCSIAFLTLISSATSPALAVIGKNFPNASDEAIASIATLNTITSVPFTILSGLILGKKIKFRTATLIGLTFSFFGGILPFFTNSIEVVLLGRAILGIGHGVSAPVMTTLILSIFKGEDVSKQFSRNSMATNIGAVLFQLLGGFLCNYSWKLPFAVNFAIVPVIIIVWLWLPEPKEAAATGLQNTKSFDFSRIFTKHLLFWSVIQAVYMLWFYGYVTQTSGIIIRNGYGNSNAAAIVLSMFTAIGVIGGAMFPKVKKVLGIKTMCLGFTINAISFISLAFANNIYVYFLFSLTFGFGYGLMQPATQYYLGIGLDKDYRAASLSFGSIIMAIGSFASAYAVKYSKILFHTDWDRCPFLVGGATYIILVLIFVFYKQPKENT